MWTQLVSKRAGQDDGSTTWIDLSKAYAINISADNATIYIGGETYTTSDEKDLEQIQSWLLRKKQSQSS
jgi:hypothetical protein